MGRIEQIAQRIVDATAPLVDGRTINIMDLRGIIMASSDPARIGSFHSGAARVVESGQALRIQREELIGYPGAREGINLPVLQEGQLVGVVGILGVPQEVEDAANLLRVCVELYLGQEATSVLLQAKKDARLAVLRTLVLGEGGKTDGLERFADGLTLPMRVAVVTWTPEEDDRENLLLYQQAEQEIAGETGLNGILGGRLVALLRDGQDGRRLQEILRNRLQREVQMAVGAPALCWAEVAVSYQEAVALLQTSESFLDAGENEGRLLFLLGNAPPQVYQRLLAPLYSRLLEGFGVKNVGWALETVRVWCAAGRSAKNAALLLHIHKNTLIYRIKKVEGLLGLEGEDTFTRECLLRMLLLYHDNLSKQLKKDVNDEKMRNCTRFF